MDLFDEVKLLFNISEEAFEIFKLLKYITIFGEGNRIVVCRNNNDKRKIVNILKKFRIEELVYVRTIQQCKENLDGLRCKEIIFI